MSVAVQEAPLLEVGPAGVQVAVPTVEEPFVKVTVPVGPLPPLVVETKADNVTLVPLVTESKLDPTAVVVLALVTVMESGVVEFELAL